MLITRLAWIDFRFVFSVISIETIKTIFLIWTTLSEFFRMITLSFKLFHWWILGENHGWSFWCHAQARAVIDLQGNCKYCGQIQSQKIPSTRLEQAIWTIKRTSHLKCLSKVWGLTNFIRDVMGLLQRCYKDWQSCSWRVLTKRFWENIFISNRS